MYNEDDHIYLETKTTTKKQKSKTNLRTQKSEIESDMFIGLENGCCVYEVIDERVLACG
jgi:hypothetical protein